MGCFTSKDGAESEVPDLEQSFYTKYKLGKKLGEGAFGQVRACTERTSGELLAVKIVDVREFDETGSSTGNVNRSREKVIKNEILLWGKVWKTKSLHIVELRRSFVEKSLYFMVCEKCDCSFMDRLVQEDCMTQADLATIFKQMLLGIAQTHACGIVHRDVKPDNFLWGGPTKDVLKLCDFGLAVTMPANGKLVKGVFGTAPYMAPELLRGSGYEFRVDVWSIGVIAYLLIYGSFPYSPAEATAKAMKAAIQDDSPRLQFKDVTKGAEGVVSGSLDMAVEFCKALLLREYEKRPTAEQVLQLPFLSTEPQKVVDQSVLIGEDGRNMRKRRERARTLTKQLQQKPSPTVQRGINDLLKMLVTKNAGDSGSNIFFSEGDRDMSEQEVQKAVSLADNRIQKTSSRRDIRHSTHSGVIVGSTSPFSKDDQPADIGRVVSLGEVSPKRPKTLGEDTDSTASVSLSDFANVGSASRV
mmetsp:Transcript_90038/g.160309  ORF Transcript_90038/g.160309 Transcript_90038/m.160309 type:complete len:471 (-) Transcript_90038:54-1466(-)